MNKLTGFFLVMVLLLLPVICQANVPADVQQAIAKVVCADWQDIQKGKCPLDKSWIRPVDLNHDPDFPGWLVFGPKITRWGRVGNMTYVFVTDKRNPVTTVKLLHIAVNTTVALVQTADVDHNNRPDIIVGFMKAGSPLMWTEQLRIDPQTGQYRLKVGTRSDEDSSARPANAPSFKDMDRMWEDMTSLGRDMARDLDRSTSGNKSCDQYCLPADHKAGKCNSCLIPRRDW